MWFRRPMIGQTYPATLGGRFTSVIDLVCWGIGDYADRLRWQPDPRMPPAQLGVIGWYVRRLLNRFLALLARAEAGALRPPRPRPSRAVPPRALPPEPPPEPPRRPERLRLPREFAWLLRRIPPAPAVGNPLAAAREVLVALLAEPELAGLLATAPQAGRVLRPLCHALGLEQLPEALRRPPRPPRPPDPAREAARAEARTAREAARAAARAEAAWGRRLRRQLGLPARAPTDVAAPPAAPAAPPAQPPPEPPPRPAVPLRRWFFKPI